MRNYRLQVVPHKFQGSQKQIDYFQRIKSLNLKSNLIIGFGISDNATFSKACEFANGAIIGSAFINFLEQKGIDKVGEFISTIKNN